MLRRLRDILWESITGWLSRERESDGAHYSDYERLRFEIRPADVLLVEGRAHVSDIIKTITRSSWSHAALYVGRVHDIQDPVAREYIRYHFHGDESEPLLIEALLDQGIVLVPLSKYRDSHIRLCRPKGLSSADAERVIRHCIACIGMGYNLRQLLDLARFMFPYSLLPRRWRSSLFEHNSGAPTRTVCSTLIAEAFHSVHFPILPLTIGKGQQIQIQQRNSRLFTPRDFDHSPYFEIIKYPLFDFDELAVYRKLPWDPAGQSHDHLGDGSALLGGSKTVS